MTPWLAIHCSAFTCHHVSTGPRLITPDAALSAQRSIYKHEQIACELGTSHVCIACICHSRRTFLSNQLCTNFLTRASRDAMASAISKGVTLYTSGAALLPITRIYVLKVSARPCARKQACTLALRLRVTRRARNKSQDQHSSFFCHSRVAFVGC